MAEDLVAPELKPDELMDDVSEDELHAPRPLSWDRRNLHIQVADPGWQNKFNWKMVGQVGLSVMYAIIYGVSFTGLNPYYEWPLETGATGEVTLESVLTDEDSFVCGDTTFYLNETGPLYSETYPISSTPVVISNGLYDILQSMGEYWGISIAFFVLFIFARLYSGKYNQLLLLVKFRKGEDGVVKPAKLSLAYTIMCNAKSFSSTVFKDLCDRMATDDTDILSFIFIGAWLFLMLLTFYWIFTNAGSCCKCMEFCCIFCRFTQEKQFLMFRILVICNTIIMFVTWIVNFNPSMQFNPKTPVLCFANVVSWCDLGISILGDIYEYLKFPNCNCSFDENEHPAADSNEDHGKVIHPETTSSDETSSDEEQGRSVSLAPHSKMAVRTVERPNDNEHLATSSDEASWDEASSVEASWDEASSVEASWDEEQGRTVSLSPHSKTAVRTVKRPNYNTRSSF